MSNSDWSITISPEIANSYTIELKKKEMDYFNLRTFERSKVPNLQNRPARTFGAGFMERLIWWCIFSTFNWALKGNLTRWNDMGDGYAKCEG